MNEINADFNTYYLKPHDILTQESFFEHTLVFSSVLLYIYLGCDSRSFGDRSVTVLLFDDCVPFPLTLLVRDRLSISWGTGPCGLGFEINCDEHKRVAGPSGLREFPR